ncbi:MAG: single-stranded-DNA-specific exonuclease RecJ, partial [Thermaurantiacus sp.]
MSVVTPASGPAEWPVPVRVDRSLSGRIWAWRAAPLSLADSARYSEDPLAARLFAARGAAPHEVPALLRPTIRDWMPDPSVFPDMDTAAARLADAVASSESVAIFTDYDVDGATSGAILIRHLRMLGLAPRHHVPDRLLEGYGPSGRALATLAEAGATLALVLDSGTQAFEAL